MDTETAWVCRAKIKLAHVDKNRLQDTEAWGELSKHLSRWNRDQSFDSTLSLLQRITLVKLWWVQKTHCKDVKSHRDTKKRCGGLLFRYLFCFFWLGRWDSGVGEGSRLSEEQGVAQVLSDRKVEPDSLFPSPDQRQLQSADRDADYFLLAH